jgi:exopolysaccharide production protein ExoZ
LVTIGQYGATVLWPLQILRFVAALMVVYIHVAQLAFQTTGSNGTFPPEFQIAGQAGVDIFFVISGVIIAKTAVGLSWQEFSWKRFRRIMPLYLLISIFALLMALRAGNAITSRDLLATFFLWPATDVMTLPQLAVAWTLCYEALFYAAATFVLASRRWLFPLLGLFAASMALRQHGAVFQFLGNPLIIEFLIGVAIAHAPAFKHARWGIPLGAAVLVAAGFFNLAPMGDAAQYLRGEEAFQRVIVYGFPSALIVWGAMQFKGRESFWTRQGDASYSLYLTHPLFLPVFFLLWKAIPLPTDVIIVISMAAAAFFGWRIHLAIELPVLNALKDQRRLALFRSGGTD